MKSLRLDRILLELGHVSDEQIRVALKRQRTHGGRLGENLVALGFLSERQLMEALSQQFDLPWRPVEAAQVPQELRDRLPDPGANGSLALPMAWEPDSGTLTVATNDPEDADLLSRLGTVFEVRSMNIVLAPDNELREARRQILDDDIPDADDGVIELPDLFAPPPGDSETTADPGEGEEGLTPAPGRVILISSRARHRTFLPPLFAREGRELVVVDTRAALVDALSAEAAEAVLLDPDRREDFGNWRRHGRLPDLPSRIAVIPPVSDALLESLVPFPEMMRSLRGAVEALADARTRDREPPPPYGLMARDASELAQRTGLPEIAVEGLHLAIHLLNPPRVASTSGRDSNSSPTAPSATKGPFEGFAASRELAVRLRFPWPVEAVLDATMALFLGPRAPEPPGHVDPELLRAAQILALVWFHHVHAPTSEAVDGDEALQMRTVLRQAAARLASMELVEAYLRVIQDRRDSGETGEVIQVLLVGGGRASDLGARMARGGIRPVVTRDLTDAQAMAERRPPAAIVVDQDAVPGHVDHFARVAKLDAALLLYVVTDSADAAVTLRLLDVGVDDVFAPPHDFDLMAARISRAIQSRSRVRSALRSRGGDFSANFDAFSFLDLAQALGHGFKSVRVELTRPGSGEDAVLYLDRGRPVHARAGSVTGAEAVYRIISWEDDGEFTVHPESDFPEPSIQDPLESLLMEGCRLLDEARA